MSIFNNNKKHRGHLRNMALFIVLGYIIIIFFGSVLLSLPIATENHEISFINSLFTATSSVCVTGFTMGDISATYTLFGEIVILLLFQIGGLGYMTLAVSMFIIMGKNVGLEERIQLKETQGVTELHGIKDLALNLVKYALIAELIGTIILFIVFSCDKNITGYNNFHYAIFHSISAFCNCGMDLFGSTYSPDCSVVPYQSNPWVLLTLAFLSIFGGFGYIAFKDLINPERMRKRTTQTKIVFSTTLIMLFLGTILFFLNEKQFSMEGMNIWQRLLNSFFLSATCRSAGFCNIDLSSMSIIAIWLVFFLETIGGSPSGTAGGIKTTTIAVLFASVKSALTKKEDTEIFSRRIPNKYVNRAITIVFLYIAICLISIIVLGITEEKIITDSSRMISLQLEVFSAISTTGLSDNIHRLFSPLGKFILILLMFAGRVGTLTIFNVLVYNNKRVLRRYPSDDVTIG